jgi:hypothetical protein
MMTPALFRIGDTVTEIGRHEPSFRQRIVSKCCTLSPRLMRSRIVSSSS